ncbi:hypothetical protein Q3G72_007074 [Acer saccharum]|nr:hypothetical protein Q3G72_007074 [Acer saccharum]
MGATTRWKLEIKLQRRKATSHAKFVFKRKCVYLDAKHLGFKDASCLTLYPLQNCLRDTFWDCALVHQRRSTSAAHRRKSPSGAPLVVRVDQRRPPAPIAQYGAAGLALVAAPDVQRSSQNWLVRWSCAGPPAQVHQRTE